MRLTNCTNYNSKSTKRNTMHNKQDLNKELTLRRQRMMHGLLQTKWKIELIKNIDKINKENRIQPNVLYINKSHCQSIIKTNYSFLNSEEDPTWNNMIQRHRKKNMWSSKNNWYKLRYKIKIIAVLPRWMIKVMPATQK